MSNRNMKNKMRRSYLKHRPVKVSRDDMRILMREAHERTKFEEKFLLGRFDKSEGDLMPSVVNRARIEAEDRAKNNQIIMDYGANHGVLVEFKLPPDVHIRDHVALVNGRSLKVFLFWTFHKEINRVYYILERNVDSGRTKQSKPYYNKADALYDFKNSQVTWILISS